MKKNRKNRKRMPSAHREIKAAYRRIGVKMGHAALLVGRHKTDTMDTTLKQRYDLTEAFDSVQDFLLHKARLEDLWPALLAHHYRMAGDPNAQKRALAVLYNS